MSSPVPPTAAMSWLHCDRGFRRTTSLRRWQRLSGRHFSKQVVSCHLSGLRCWRAWALRSYSSSLQHCCLRHRRKEHRSGRSDRSLVAAAKRVVKTRTAGSTTERLSRSTLMALQFVRVAQVEPVIGSVCCPVLRRHGTLLRRRGVDHHDKYGRVLIDCTDRQLSPRGAYPQR